MRGFVGMANKQSRSIVDTGMVITGNVSCTGALEVSGQIQGNLQCRNLTLSQPGHIHGDVFCETVDIDSRIDGTIRSRQVILRSQAQVIGDIHHTSLSIENGAFFEGEVRRSENLAQVQSSAPRSAPSQLAAQNAPHSEPLRQEPLELPATIQPVPWSRTG